MIVFIMLEPAQKMGQHAKTAISRQRGSMPRYQMQGHALQTLRAAFSLLVAA